MHAEFLSHCARGELEAAQRIWASHSHEMNLSESEGICFRRACFGGHLLVAQWLLTVNPDLHLSVWGESAFCQACHNGHLDIAQWLLDVHPVDTWTLTLDVYRTSLRFLFGRRDPGWVDVATRVLAMHPEWDPERADALGVGSPAYLLK